MIAYTVYVDHEQCEQSTERDSLRGVSLLLQIEAATKSFPGFALGPLSLELEPGMVLGFAGPNGAGKTTTLKMIMGLLQPDSGELHFLDSSIDRRLGAWKNEIGYVAEDQVFYEGWNGSQNLEFQARLHGGWCMDRAEGLAKRLDLDLAKQARNLSRGNRVKLALVSALSYQPRLLLLDEPTSGLDPITRTEVLDLLLEYTSCGERSVLFSTHIIPDLARIADIVTFINDGLIIRSGAPADITETWRKIRFRFPFKEIDLPGVVMHKVDGDVHLVVTSELQESKKKLEGLGAMIGDSHPISLEEAAVYILKGGTS